VSYSKWYLLNANPDANHNANLLRSTTVNSCSVADRPSDFMSENSLQTNDESYPTLKLSLYGKDSSLRLRKRADALFMHWIN